MPRRCLLFVWAIAVVSAGQATACAGQWDKQVALALERAGENRSELARSLREVAPDQLEAMQFLIANMPDTDLQQLSAEYLLDNVRWAYRAWNQAPWKKRVSHDMFLNNVLPFASVNERRDNWRKDFYEQFHPLVKDATTPAAAAAILNQRVFPQLKVKYSRKRRRADQGPRESIETGLASCTGLSILLIDACRAVGVPARFAGTPLWSDNSGNHSWVEIWDDGWHFTGAAEPTGDELDRAWFVVRASKAQRDDMRHAIYAVSFRRTPLHFPLVWDRQNHSVYAVNVTDRYTRRQGSLPAGAVEVMFRVIGTADGQRRAAELQVGAVDGRIVCEGTTKDERFDGNDHLAVVLPKKGRYKVKVNCGETDWTESIEVNESGQLFTFKLPVPIRQGANSRPVGSG